MSGFRYEKDSSNIVTITMDMPGESVNTMNDVYEGYVIEILDRLEKDNISGVIITSGKETFCAGGNLNSLLEYTDNDKEAIFNNSTAMKVKRALRRLETLGKPVVAAINGAALGGGYELCLATHHRIATKNPKSVIGLPEVSLGLMPGCGGIVRLVRLLGLEKALPFLMEGTKLKPEQALAAGLVDELAEDRDEMLAKARTWIMANPDAKQPWDRKEYMMPGGLPSNPKTWMMLITAPVMFLKTPRGLMSAPESILSAAVDCAQVDMDTALRIESRYFVELVVSPVAKKLITSFLSRIK